MSYIIKNVKNSPIKGYDRLNISSRFGFRSFYNSITKKTEKSFHNGIDIITGKYAVAAYTGEVTKVIDGISGYSTKYPTGNAVTIHHENDMYTVYYHLKKGSIRVKKGDVVEKGTILGELGATGHATGVHLHFGIKCASSWVDPEKYIFNNLENSSKKDKEYVEYKILKGDTLSEIANKFGTDFKTLAYINNVGNPNLIIEGDILKIPISIKTKYKIKKGDNLTKIAKEHGTTWQTLYEKNKHIIGKNPNLIIEGDMIDI